MRIQSKTEVLVLFFQDPPQPAGPGNGTNGDMGISVQVSGNFFFFNCESDRAEAQVV